MDFWVTGQGAINVVSSFSSRIFAFRKWNSCVAVKWWSCLWFVGFTMNSTSQGLVFPIEDHVTFIPFTSTLYLCLSLVMAKFSRAPYHSYCTMKFTNLRCEWRLPPTLRENHAIALTNLHLYFYKCFEVVYFMLIVTTYVFSVGTLWPSDIVLLSSHKGRIVEPVSRSRSRSPRPRYEYFFLGGYDPDDMWGTASLNKIAWCSFLHGNNLGYGWFCSNSCELISLRIIIPNIKPGVRGYLVLTIFSTNVGGT